MARAKTAREWRALALLRCYLADVPKLHRIRISAVIYRRALGRADEDNDRARLVNVVNGIVSAGVVPDDTRAYIAWGPCQEARGAPALEVTIEEIVDADATAAH